MENKSTLRLIIGGIIILALVIYGLISFNKPNDKVNSPINNQNNDKQMSPIITLETTLGEIQFETYSTDAPKTVANFVKLAKAGYYDGLIFHRVISGFMIQGGDPNCSPELSKQPATGPCGTGGPGYQFEDELDPATPSYQAGYKKGIVAMANAGPNTNGSQFFIMLEDYPLPNDYTIFGKVIKGQEIVDKIGAVEVGGNDKPLESIRIIKASVAGDFASTTAEQNTEVAD